MKLNKHRIDKTIRTKLPEHKVEYDDEGRAIIDMTVKDDSNFLSAYSTSETAIISTEVAEFIENNTHSIPPGQQLTLRIHSECIDEKEKLDYQAGIKKYYAEKYLASKNEYRFNLFAVLLLALAGIATLILAFNVEHHIWSEVIDIAAWVFLWESVDIGVFKNRETNIKRRRYLSYISMNIEFMPLIANGK